MEKSSLVAAKLRQPEDDRVLESAAVRILRLLTVPSKLLAAL